MAAASRQKQAVSNGSVDMADMRRRGEHKSGMAGSVKENSTVAEPQS
jgi:hypothetical protein